MAVPVVPTLATLGASAATFFIAQATAVGGDTTIVAILGAAVTGLAGLVGWMVRQLMSGNWVRSETADLVKQHEAATEALAKSNELSQRLIDVAFGSMDG
ncbi:MAG: hypothetical protein AAF567_24595 [Actinomycetota bacterium]